MRPLSLLAAALLACACEMPALPEGYQLQCTQSSDCPDGTSCSRSCCVKQGEAPTCRETPWRSGVGGPCTKDDECAQGLTCLTEAAVGPVGGLCTRSCSHGSCLQNDRCRQVPALAAAAGMATSDVCLPQCPGNGDTSCRPGFHCACDANQNNCGCVPGCSQSGQGACDPDPTKGQTGICNADTGLCMTAAAR